MYKLLTPAGDFLADVETPADIESYVANSLHEGESLQAVSYENYSRPFSTPRLAVIAYNHAIPLDLYKPFGLVCLALYGSLGEDELRRTAGVLRQQNPKVLLSNYLNWSELSPSLGVNDDQFPLLAEVNRNDWWLYNAAHVRTQQFEQTGKFDINGTAATRANAAGQRWPQFLVQWARLRFPAGVFDFAFIDNAIALTRIAADWNRDGRDEPKGDPIASAAQRAGIRAILDAGKPVFKLPYIGNLTTTNDMLDSPQYAGQFAGGMMEAAIGKDWSVEHWGGFDLLMKCYLRLMAELPGPIIFGVRSDNPQEQLYGLCAGLLGDGYISIAGSDPRTCYTSAPIILPEFNLPIGTPMEPAQRATSGVWSRHYTNAIISVDPTARVGSISIMQRS